MAQTIYEKTLPGDVAGDMIFGERDRYLDIFSRYFCSTLFIRGDRLNICGDDPEEVKCIKRIIEILIQRIQQGKHVQDKELHQLIQNNIPNSARPLSSNNSIVFETLSGKKICPKTDGQCRYVESIKKYDMVVGIGPAGTGKTFLAVAAALDNFQKRKCDKIILTRPAIEAGERLGYLPGDIEEKILPYLRPLYDAMIEMIGADKLQKMIMNKTLEIAPLAFMRGRTLNSSFVILDEAQNCSPEQMKMFLTRMGWNSYVVITGDITQIDLPSNAPSGLVEIQNILKDIPDISFVNLTQKDIIRHPLVQKIVNAYETKEKSL